MPKGKVPQELIGIWNTGGIKRFKSMHEASDFFGRSESTLYNYISKGYKVAGEVRLVYASDYHPSMSTSSGEDFITKEIQNYPEFLKNKKSEEAVLCRVSDTEGTKEVFIVCFLDGYYMDTNSDLYTRAVPISASEEKKKILAEKLHNLVEEKNSINEKIEELRGFLKDLGVEVK